MERLFKFGKAGVALVAVLCFLTLGCEKPKLKNADANSDPSSKEAIPAKVEETVQTPAPGKSKPDPVGKSEDRGEVKRIVAEKRMPEPGEGALPEGDRPPEAVKSSNTLNIKYPVGRTLINYQNQKKTPADIIGRDGGSITVILKSTGERVDIPIAELSKPDQTFVSFLPVKAPPAVKKIVPKPAYLVLREKDLDNLKDQAAAMRRDIVRNGKKLIIVRAIKKRLKILEGKIVEMEQEIAIYKATNGIVD